MFPAERPHPRRPSGLEPSQRTLALCPFHTKGYATSRFKKGCPKSVALFAE